MHAPGGVTKFGCICHICTHIHTHVYIHTHVMLLTHTQPCKHAYRHVHIHSYVNSKYIGWLRQKLGQHFRFARLCCISSVPEWSGPSTHWSFSGMVSAGHALTIMELHRQNPCCKDPSWDNFSKHGHTITTQNSTSTLVSSCCCFNQFFQRARSIVLIKEML